MLLDTLHEQGIRFEWQVENAILQVPRQAFFPGVDPAQLYSDSSIPLYRDLDGEVICSSTSPSMIGFVLEQLDLFDGANVLEIGTGTGYIAALIRNIIGKKGSITTLEIDPIIAESARDHLLRATISDVNVVTMDGAAGYAPRAAYDRIITTTGIWDMPEAWVRQLKPGGRIVAPVIIDGLQVMGAFMLQPDGSLLTQYVMPSAFTYIRGMASGPTMRKRIGTSSLSILGDQVSKIDAVALHTLLSSDYERINLSDPLDDYEFWYGFLPYMMLHEKPDEIFMLYYVLDDQKAYGIIHGNGFALLTAASICFVPYYGLGDVHYFAGSDAFMAVDEHLKSWQDAESPTIERLRLCLIPKSQPQPEIETGKLYTRRDHYLHVWFEKDEKADTADETLA